MMNKLVKRLISFCFSKQPKFYTIPFGQIKGMKLFTSFNISPRMLFGFDETWVAKMAKLYLSKGDIVYDIGAHIGYTSLLFSKLIDFDGKVYAFELLPNVVDDYLKRTIEANGLENIIITHSIGLSDKKEELSIYVGNTMMGTLDKVGYETSYMVKCRTEALDRYFQDYELLVPKLIKVDIERAEIKFLEGARSIIEKYKPILIIEFHNIDLLKKGFQLLSEMGYKIETEDGNISYETVENMNSFHANIIAIPFQ